MHLWNQMRYHNNKRGRKIHSRSKLRIALMRSVNNRRTIVEARELMRQCGYDVLAEFEFWFNSKVFNAEIEISDYKRTRLDRLEVVDPEEKFAFILELHWKSNVSFLSYFVVVLTFLLLVLQQADMMLTKNAENLMQAVVKTLKAAEAACMKASALFWFKDTDKCYDV